MKYNFLPGEENIAKRPDIREKIRLSKLKYATRPCSTCAKIINTYPSRLKKENQFCSRGCLIAWRKSRKGELAFHWQGGRTTDKSGYIAILVPEHPYADHRGYVREHRLVMEKHLGRYLKADEIIHHLDFSKDNNDISNLVLTNRQEHLVKYHHESLIKRLQPKER